MAALIFDFDGTIADTFETVVGIFYELPGRKKFLTPEEIQKLRGLSLAGVTEELHVSPWRIPFLLMLGRRRMKRRMHTIKAHAGIPEMIKKLHNEGHQLYILSSNSERNIQLFLSRHDMAYAFVKIYGGVGLFGKAHMLKKVIKQNRLDRKDTWYVGDEVRDVAGAKAADVRIMAVGWGYNTAEILAKHEPTKLIGKPADIIATMEEV